jgi:hypothetical protein
MISKAAGHTFRFLKRGVTGNSPLERGAENPYRNECSKRLEYFGSEA